MIAQPLIWFSVIVIMVAVMWLAGSFDREEWGDQ